VDAVAGQELLADEAGDGAVDEQRRAVVQRLLEVHRQADGDDQPAGQRGQRLELGQGLLLQRWHEERVLAAVAGDGQLGQQHQAGALGPGRGDGLLDAGAIAVPVHRGLVQTGDGDLDQLHGGLQLSGCG
jgi:hypothetical protein